MANTVTKEEAAAPAEAAGKFCGIVPTYTWIFDQNRSLYGVGAVAIRRRGKKTLDVATLTTAYFGTPHFCGGLEVYGTQGSKFSIEGGRFGTNSTQILRCDRTEGYTGDDPFELFPEMAHFPQVPEDNKDDLNDIVFRSVAAAILARSAGWRKNCVIGRDRIEGRVVKLFQHMEEMSKNPLPDVVSYGNYGSGSTQLMERYSPFTFPRSLVNTPVFNFNSSSRCTVMVLTAGGTDEEVGGITLTHTGIVKPVDNVDARSNKHPMYNVYHRMWKQHRI